MHQRGERKPEQSTFAMRLVRHFPSAPGPLKSRGERGEQPVDVVVNNAGVARWDTLETIDLDAAREEIYAKAQNCLLYTSPSPRDRG